VKEGKLWSRLRERLSEEPDEQEYLPWGPETFFIKDYLGSVTFTFVRDAQGHVSGYTWHLVDGQEIHVKKIK